MRFELTAEVAQKTAAVAAGSSGTAAIFTGLQDVPLQLLGVQLPVLLAALAGAWLVRAYLPPIGLVKAIGRVTGWLVLGCVLAPVAGAIVAKLVGIELPTNALAGMAAIVAAGEGWPAFLLWLREKFPEYFRRGGQQ